MTCNDVRVMTATEFRDAVYEVLLKAGRSPREAFHEARDETFLRFPSVVESKTSFREPGQWLPDGVWVCGCPDEWAENPSYVKACPDCDVKRPSFHS